MSAFPDLIPKPDEPDPPRPPTSRKEAIERKLDYLMTRLVQRLKLISFMLIGFAVNRAIFGWIGWGGNTWFHGVNEDSFGGMIIVIALGLTLFVFSIASLIIIASTPSYIERANDEDRPMEVVLFGYFPAFVTGLYFGWASV